MDIENFGGLVLAIILGGYVLFALFRPEDF